MMARSWCELSLSEVIGVGQWTEKQAVSSQAWLGHMDSLLHQLVYFCLWIVYLTCVIVNFNCPLDTVYSHQRRRSLNEG